MTEKPIANKELLFDENARAAITKGAQELCDAVKVTMGPKGRNVGIYDTRTIYDEAGNASIIRDFQITKDGVTVAKSIGSKDKFVDFAIQAIVKTAIDTCAAAGDGTTTATVLAAAMVRHGMKAINSGGSPVLIKRGIDKAVKLVTDEISRISKPIGADMTELKFVANVSANNDEEIGSLVYDAVIAVGKDGIIRANGGVGINSGIEIKEGFSIDMGASSLAFINDRAKMQSVFKDPLIVIYEHTPNKSVEVTRICQMAKELERPLLLFCEGIEDEAAAFMAINNIRGAIKCAVVKNPYGSDLKKDFCKDVALITGAIVISNDEAKSLERVDLDDCGSADEIVITMSETRIVGGKGDKELVVERIEELTQRLNSETNYSKTMVESRIGKLKGKAAIITIGANSEVDAGEKLDRTEDAIWATRSAIEEGIVPGGGSVFILAQKVLKNMIKGSNDESIGAKIVYDAIEEPLMQIAVNAGKTGGMEVEGVRKSTRGYGWNALTDKNEDLVKNGIIDPTKVSRSALQFASSTAGILLTTDCIIVNEQLS